MSDLDANDEVEPASTLITSRVPSRLVLEGLTIVIGILLAFGIDACWDNMNAAAAERALLSDVVEELSQIAVQLERGAATHEAHRIAAESILNDARLGAPQMAEAVAILMSFLTVDLSTGALDAALSTDGLGRIASDSTRVLLARWPGAFVDIVENESLELELVEQYLNPLLRTRLSLPDLVSYAEGPGIPRDPVVVTMQIRDSVSLLRDLRLLNDDAQFQGLVLQLGLNDSAMAEEYDTLQLLVTSLVEAAKSSLER